MKRDPRIDPKRGDVTKAQDGYTYRVISASGGNVKWEDVEDGYTETCALEDWRQWAKTDEIVKVAA